MRCKDLPTRGFTLIELLVVIALLGILIGLVMPSVKGAKDAAKRSTTSTLLYTISQGLEMFKSEELFGRTYPPSYWLAAGKLGGNPYNADKQNFSKELEATGAQLRAAGAQTLVWALVGADMRGTPGFQQDLGDLYELNTQGGDPLYPRRGPYVDITNIDIKPPKDTAVGFDLLPPVPVFVDSFDMPILYYRAGPGPDYYLARHNQAFTINVKAKPPGNEEPKSTRYHLDIDGQYGDPSSGGNGLRGFITDTRLFELTGQWQPYKKESFILLSAGKDMRYGTGDDILNFKKK